MRPLFDSALAAGCSTAPAVSQPGHVCNATDADLAAGHRRSADFQTPGNAQTFMVAAPSRSFLIGT